jgi:hypothetical protein
MDAMIDGIDAVIRTFTASIHRAIDAEVKRQVGQLVRELPEKPAPEAEVSADKGKRGPKEGSKAQAKPCPVTGVLNTHRRFSYLMPEARTPENLAKFKRGGK